MDSVVKQDDTFGDFKDDPEEKNVKSTAIVKFAAVQAPMYAELQSNTDLNLPPANWLRKVQGLGGYGTLDINTRNEFSSFHMANNFPDCIGEVDVVSAAENIKKLLKIPYSKAQVSMLIHRIGKTILVDEFDIHKHLLRTSQDDLQWLKKFYFEHVLQSLTLKEKAFPRKNKSRYHLQHKSMFSKFLYHSIADFTEASNYSADGDSSLLINPQQFSDQIHIEEEEEQEETQTLYGEHKFLRDVLWTFEDITMLIGTDMPIFGGGKRPCVSLRLRDKNKPINILTGLDYWLDNLMCNVPEIMMCYHLDGIVQQYELLKTEDIPKLNNNCNFSPKVIKDVAQNILSFLKSNATKTGHTYWLFKGKDDDVIKLYDLTTLCLDNMMEGKGQNPFAIHVAMLFYTLARNLHGQPDLSNKNRANMHFFLEKCIRMLEDAGTPQLMASAQFLLADLLVKNFSEDFSIEFVMEESNLTSHSSDDSSDDNSSTRSPSVEVESLRKTNRIRRDVCDNALVKRKLTDDPTERCLLALEHIFKGLDLINENPAGRGTPLYDDAEKIQARLAKPFQAIPLKYSSLASSKSKKYSDSARIKGRSNCGRCGTKCWISLSHQPNCPQANVPWQVSYKLHLLEKGGIILCFLAERAFSQDHLGIALRYLQMIFMCLEGIEAINATCEEFRVDPNLLPNALGLTGDVHNMLAKFHQNELLYVEDFSHLPEGWEVLSASIPKEDLCFTNYESFWEVKKSVEDHLFVSTQCYEEALSYTVENDDQIKRLKKRHGNALNDLGVMYMNNAKSLFEEKGVLTEVIRTLCTKSCNYLTSGVDAFKSVDDQTNVALLSSNLGRLMRLCAHTEALSKGERRKEFSAQERRYFQRALTYYEVALAALREKHTNLSIWQSVTWDYSTTLFTMATILQDNAPLSSRSQEDVETEVASLLNRALAQCKLDGSSSTQPLYQYRAATIHHRLASLYHHAVRNQMVENTQKQKQMRLLAEEHYNKSSELFALIEHTTDYLRVQLEQIGMHEYTLQDKPNGPSRTKLLKHILNIILNCEIVLSTSQIIKDGDSTKDDPDDEFVNILSLLEKRFQVVLLSLIKVNKGNVNQLNFYKRLYSLSLVKSVAKVDKNKWIQDVISALKNVKDAFTNVEDPSID